MSACPRCWRPTDGPGAQTCNRPHTFPEPGPMGRAGWLTCSACHRTWHPDYAPVHHCKEARDD